MAAEATTSVAEADTTSAFLSDLLGSIGMGKGPEKQITDLNLNMLTRIVSFIPLRERMELSYVSHQFRGAVKASITSINFYRDCLDGLPDDQVKEMLHQYGSQITGLNFDLFKSTFSEETSQWVWRQTVLAFASLCPNLRELSILICNRHRLRDKDLVTIFEKCPNLTKLCVDAQFLNGHCFKKAPLSLSHVEMEMCYRISDQSLRIMFSRFRKMRVLHFSQLLILSDAHIALMVRSFRNLRELSIVSHVDTKYEHLSGSGLAELGKLHKLRVLCLEGLGAVTDRTLTVISDPQTSPTAATIASLSLAFCYNVSQHGLKHLGRMTSLVDLNIDGITKRDVSMGVEKIAAEGRLARLFIAERTNISPEALVSVVQTCPHLRLLDISNNEECFNWVTADKMLYLWCSPHTAGETSSTSAARPPTRRAPLTILTDEHLAWNIVSAPEPDEYGRPPVLVVHINRAAVPESELLPTNALSNVRPSELPTGLLAPHIRRGNRYRLLWAPLGPSKDLKCELYDENENGTSVAELALRAAQDAEDGGSHERSCDSLDDAEYSSSAHSMEGVECVEGLFGASSELGAGAGLPWNGGAAGNEENMPPHATRPADFSFTPISAEGDPHSKDWSMDVISLLLKTYAYEDGAMVGPMTVKEGIIMRPDGSVEDICSSILHVDASLRARYHMTAALHNGPRRHGAHSYNTAQRVVDTDAAAADIASAIDDFLGGYVPEENNNGGCDPPMAYTRPPPPTRHPHPQALRDLREFPYEREMLQRSTDLFSATSPSFMCSPPPPLDSLDCATPFDDDLLFGQQQHHGNENEAPPTFGAGGGAFGYYVPGGRVEGSGPKVAPVRYGSSHNDGSGNGGYRNPQPHSHKQHQQYHPQQQQEYRHPREQMPNSRHQEQRPPLFFGGRSLVEAGEQQGGYHRNTAAATGPRSAHEDKRVFHAAPGSGRHTPFVPMHQRGGGLLSAPPPSSISSSFPFPPPAYLLTPDGGCVSASGAPPTVYPLNRPYGRVRKSTASPAWLDASSGAKLAPSHPYQDAFRARPSAPRASILKPRN